MAENTSTSWSIKFSSIAEKYFNKLDRKKRQKIAEKLRSLAKLPNPLEHPQVQPLTAELKGFYRLREGNYRIIFSVLSKEKIIAVVNVFPRGKGY